MRIDMTGPWHARHALALAWTLALIAGEAGVFWASSHSCASPGANRGPGAGARPGAGPDGATIAVVADPQLTDAFSYGQRPGSLALRLTEFYSDLYMRRAYRLAVGVQRPDRVVFLGDLFDGGRVADDAAFAEHVARFEAIFGADWGRFVFAAGNHDVGLGRYFAPRAAQHFRQTFGARSKVHQVCHKRLVVLDGPALVNAANDVRTDHVALEEVAAVLTEASVDSDDLAALLFTHIPLWRPREVHCERSARRYKPNLKQGAGVSYQNLLDRDTSAGILSSVRPEIVFSGDDHDTCVVSHATSAGLVKEYTVATFSWLQGVRHPGFALVRLEGCGRPLQRPARVARVELCQLPDQLLIYACYAILACASIILLGLQGRVHWPWTRRPRHHSHAHAYAYGRASHGTGSAASGERSRVSPDIGPAVLRKRVPLLSPQTSGADVECGVDGDPVTSDEPSQLAAKPRLGCCLDIGFVIAWGVSVYMALLVLV